jgi:hypothetical protein
LINVDEVTRWRRDLTDQGADMYRLCIPLICSMCALTLMGCGFLGSEEPTQDVLIIEPEGWETPEAPANSPVHSPRPPVPIAEIPAQPPLQLPDAAPAPDGCERSIAASPSASISASLIEPTLIERLDARGCVTERTQSRYDRAGRVIERLYEILDPSQLEPTYVVPHSYHQTFRYDGRGEIVHSLRRDPYTFEVLHEMTRQLDERGLLLSERHVGSEHYPSDDLVWEQRWEYNERDQVTRHDHLHNEAMYYSILNTYDAQGRLIERSSITSRGELLSERNEYDGASERPSKTDRFDHEGSLSTTEHYTYALGKLATRVELNHRHGERSLSWFDEQERVVRFELRPRHGDTPHRVHELTYDDKGRIIHEQISTPAGRRLQRESETTRTFDEHDRPLTEHRQTNLGDYRGTMKRWSWEADGSGLYINAMLNWRGDELVHERATLRPSGEPAKRQYFNVQQGARLWREDIFSYDAAERLLSIDMYTPAGPDGVGGHHYSTRYTYDAHGRLIQHREGGDGVFYRHEERRY